MSQWNNDPPSFLYRDDPRSKFILEVREKEGPDAAVLALTILLKGSLVPREMNQLPVAALTGILKGYLLQSGAISPSPYQAPLLNDFFNQESAKFEKSRQDFEDTHRQSTERLAAINSELQKTKLQSTEIQTQADKQSANFAQTLESSRKRMKDFEDTYNAKLALLAPVTYWRKKALTHLYLAIGFGFASLVMGVGVGVYIINEVQKLLNVSPGQQPETWRVAVLLVVGSLFIYLLRIVVKLFLSQFHLQTDASQRAIMVETYLSLEREGKLANPEDKKLILDALFRPVGAGLVQDDQAAVSLVEGLISKLK